MRNQGMILVAFIFSIVQASLAYFLHNDMISVEMFQWIVSVIYIPLYFVLLLIGGLLEVVFGLNLLKGGVVFPYLHDALWAVGGILLLPLNLWLLKLGARCKLRT
ncbi:hypothetical protein [Vibrio antiquarius]|uniref:hypothetical protein n=1 Tax=Vibrio antiquarius (strain Ex25) TaxID=150340 RepID=UPI002657DC3E|nr:hypothetical protein [Vibrio antiquarius]MCR9366087.1 hypothetical protein [Vibrio antiquarius]